MRSRITLVLLLGLALLTLAALAHASPPDQTWLPGIYDDADFDDVIGLITSLSGAPPDADVAISSHGSITSALAFSPAGALFARPRRPDDARSPPRF